jgi:hypothetical protein
LLTDVIKRASFDRYFRMAWLRGFLLRASIFIAVGWVWFNYMNGTFYPMRTVSEQAEIVVLVGLALYAVTGVPPS